MLSKEQLLSTVLEDSFIAEYTACFLLHIPLIYVSYLRLLLALGQKNHCPTFTAIK